MPAESSSPLPTDREKEESGKSPVFTATELKRVGTAATMVAVCGTIIIIAMTVMLGHYNSFAHSGPKAVLDGAVIALLIGRQGRWRCLALLGIVYGLVLLLQVGVFYLLPVMVVAGAVAAGAGRAIDMVHRGSALVTAAIVYELLAGCGAPIKIYFGTSGGSEPFVWSLWFAEWPMRIIGAAMGVWLARKRPVAGNRDVPVASLPTIPRDRPAIQGTVPVALCLIASLVACTVPLTIESVWILSGLAILYVAYAVVAGLRKQIIHAFLALLWGWLVFGILSYAWNRDMNRVLDMGRSLVLRFAPVTLSAMVLVSTVRPLDILRLLRRMRISPVILIPLSSVIRAIPQARMTIRHSIQQLREQGHWNGPMSLLLNPITTFRALLRPHVTRWVDELSEKPDAISPRDPSV